MSTDRVTRLIARDKKVVKLFNALRNKKYKGVQAYSNARIIYDLCDEFNLSESSVEKIIYGRAKYKAEATIKHQD